MFWLEKFDSEGAKDSLEFFARRRIATFILLLAVLFFRFQDAIMSSDSVLHYVQLLPSELTHALTWFLLLYFVALFAINLPRSLVDYGRLTRQQAFDDRVARIDYLLQIIEKIDNYLEKYVDKITEIATKDIQNRGLTEGSKDYETAKSRISEAVEITMSFSSERSHAVKEINEILNTKFKHSKIDVLTRFFTDFIRIYLVYIIAILVLMSNIPLYNYNEILIR